jgi:hypothetical protein
LKTNAQISLKGLRDIGTVRTVVARQQKNQRSHIVGRYSRLDAERTRIEREIDMWSARKKTSEIKLAAVLKEIEAILPALIDTPLHKTNLSKAKIEAFLKVQGSNKRQHNTVSLNY